MIPPKPGDQGEYFHVDELQIYGKAHLAIDTNNYYANSSLIISDLNDSSRNLTVVRLKNTIGDRTGSVHIGPGHRLAFDDHSVDLPFNTYVYEDGLVGISVQEMGYIELGIV